MDVYSITIGIIYFLLIFSTIYMGFRLWNKSKNSFLKSLTITSTALALIGFFGLFLNAVNTDFSFLIYAGITGYILLFALDFIIGEKK